VCKYFGTSKSGYYKKLTSLDAVSIFEDVVVTEVKQIRSDFPYYGTRRLWEAMKKTGFSIGREHLRKILKKYGFILPVRYKKIHTSIPGNLQISPQNLIKGLDVTHKNQIWVTDITYVHTLEGIVYVSALMDIYSRKIISAYVSTNLKTSSSLLCLQGALKSVKHTKGIIHHSDHGTQYCSYDNLNTLLDNEMEVSFTGKDHCYDNAKIERFWKTLKYEYGLKAIIKSKYLANKLIMNAIDNYNNYRLHSALNYRVPEEVYNAA
jgi:putative transposase